MVNKLYNEEIKERFLSTYDNEQTQKTLRNVFYNTELIENVLDKDLYDFTIEELGKAIENTNPHSKSVAMSTGRFISQYVSWAIDPPQRLRKNAINPLKGVLSEWYDDRIDKTKKIHYSYDEFIEMLENEIMYNQADKAFLFLMWEGIIGEKFSEIRELKYSDIDKDNKTVYVKERDEHVPVSEDCIKYLQQAYDQPTYYQYNMNTKEFTEKELLPSKFIFKNIKSPRGTEGLPIGLNVLYSRIHALKEILSLEYLSPQSIRQSGMIKMAVDIYLEEGILAYEQLAKIGEKYDYSTIINQNTGEPYYNTYLMREFISSDNISDLYGLNIEIKLR